MAAAHTLLAVVLEVPVSEEQEEGGMAALAAAEQLLREAVAAAVEVMAVAADLALVALLL